MGIFILINSLGKQEQWRYLIKDKEIDICVRNIEFPIDRTTTTVYNEYIQNLQR